MTEFHFGWPQWATIVYFVGHAAYDIIEIGKHKTVSIIRTFPLMALVTYIEYMGGFYSHIMWPQIVSIVLTVFGAVLVVMMNGTLSKSTWFSIFIAYGLSIFLLVKGGFFG